MSVQYRINRLLGTDGKCCEVAMDHGVHNEPTFLAGIENLGRVVDQLVAAGADALLLSMGQAHLLQIHKGRRKPSLVVRADPTSFYGTPAPSQLSCNLVERAVERAAALDAAAVVANLMWTPEQPDIHRQCVMNISKLKPECERYGMPLMVEPLSWVFDGKTRSYIFNPHLVRYTSLVRQAVELGADVVKADPSENLADYPRIIETASGKPVLVRGGSRISDHELLVRTHALMELGAAGVVYGRNIYQHSRPEKMLRACKAIVHENASVTEAEAFLTAN
jgi:DhnA family fructose-bisphosphate aldolase class Ia